MTSRRGTSINTRFLSNTLSSVLSHNKREEIEQSYRCLRLSQNLDVSHENSHAVSNDAENRANDRIITDCRVNNGRIVQSKQNSPKTCSLKEENYDNFNDELYESRKRENLRRLEAAVIRMGDDYGSGGFNNVFNEDHNLTVSDYRSFIKDSKWRRSRDDTKEESIEDGEVSSEDSISTSSMIQKKRKERKKKKKKNKKEKKEKKRSKPVEVECKLQAGNSTDTKGKSGNHSYTTSVTENVNLDTNIPDFKKKSCSKSYELDQIFSRKRTSDELSVLSSSSSGSSIRKRTKKKRRKAEKKQHKEKKSHKFSSTRKKKGREKE